MNREIKIKIYILTAAIILLSIAVALVSSRILSETAPREECHNETPVVINETCCPFEYDDGSGHKFPKDLCDYCHPDGSPPPWRGNKKPTDIKTQF